MALKEDLANAVAAGGEVHALGAARQYLQAGLLKLLGVDGVVARMRYVKAGIDVAN